MFFASLMFVGSCNDGYASGRHLSIDIGIRSKWTMSAELKKRGGSVAIAMERNRSTRDVTRIIFDAMNRRDLSDLEQYISDEAVFDFPGAGCIKGRKRILILFKVLFRKYPRLTFRLEDIIAEGNRTCAIWSNEGEDQKGNPYTNRGVTLVTLRDGQIVSISDYFKDTSFVESSR